MNLDNDVRIDAAPHGRPFQFSLRTMFIVTTMVAVWCGGLFAPYAWARFLTLALWVFTVPVVLLVMVIYARGYMRTFAIGGLVTTLPLLFCHIVLAYVVVAAASSAWSSGTADWSNFSAADDGDDSHYVPGIFCGIYSALIFMFGFLAMGVRWLVESPHRPHRPRTIVEPPHNLPEVEVSNPTQETEIATS